MVANFLVTFRKPLTAFLGSLAGRAIKLSVFIVSIDLAALPASPLPWSDPNIPENSQMIGGDVGSTAFMELLNRIGVMTPWDYLIVDIKDGHF